MGYQREQIVVLKQHGGLRGNLEAFKAEIRRNPSIVNVAGSSCLPNDITGQTFANWPGKPKTTEIPIYFLEADINFVELYGLDIVQGRSFSRVIPSDAKGAFLINESAAKALGWKDPIGRPFIRWGNPKAEGSIVGVVKDFHMHSLHLPIMPLWIFLNPSRTDELSIRIRGENIPQTMAFLRESWARFSPESPFEYSFFDEIFDKAYRTEQRLGTLFGAFSGMAIFIACLGLLGLASFTAEQKTKEIGIRKVLGASASGIIVMFSRGIHEVGRPGQSHRLADRVLRHADMARKFRLPDESDRSDVPGRGPDRLFPRGGRDQHPNISRGDRQSSRLNAL